MDAFNRLFSNEKPPLTLLSNLGLSLADALGPMKQLIMRRALGQVGELPRLVRPLILESWQ